jgi:methylmalonyl-CoA/ethylmalonyl-CoA epimerase
MADAAEGPPPFVGTTVQVALVTDDFYRGLDDLIALGIGPFGVFEVTPESSTEQRYHGEPGEFSFRLAFATANDMMWEVIAPGEGKNIFTDFLEGGGIGFHHVAITTSEASFADQVSGLEERGYREIQGGRAFGGAVPYGYYHNGNPDSPIVEIFEFPEGFEPPAIEVYPPEG